MLRRDRLWLALGALVLYLGRYPCVRVPQTDRGFLSGFRRLNKSVTVSPSHRKKKSAHAFPPGATYGYVRLIHKTTTAPHKQNQSAHALSSLEAPVTSAEGALTCPRQWRDGETQVLKCTLRRAGYTNDTCAHFTDVVDFQFTPAGASLPSSECRVHNLTQSCDGRFVSRNCRCREVADGCFVLELALTVDRDKHQGGSWRCVPGCADTFLRNPYLHPPNAEPLRCGPVLFDQCGTNSSPELAASGGAAASPTSYVTAFMTYSFQPFVMTHVFYMMNFM